MAEMNSEICRPCKPSDQREPEKLCKPCDTDDEMDAEENSCPYPSCGCVGYGYVPLQRLNCTYDVKTAIMNGTVFPELDLDMCEYGAVCKKWGGTVDE